MVQAARLKRRRIEFVNYYRRLRYSSTSWTCPKAGFVLQLHSVRTAKTFQRTKMQVLTMASLKIFVSCLFRELVRVHLPRFVRTLLVCLSLTESADVSTSSVSYMGANGQSR